MKKGGKSKEDCKVRREKCKKRRVSEGTKLRKGEEVEDRYWKRKRGRKLKRINNMNHKRWLERKDRMKDMEREEDKEQEQREQEEEEQEQAHNE